MPGNDLSAELTVLTIHCPDSSVSAVLRGFKPSNVSCFLKTLSTAIFTLFSLSHSLYFLFGFILLTSVYIYSPPRIKSFSALPHE